MAPPPSVAAIRAAVALLQSIQVENLCIPFAAFQSLAHQDGSFLHSSLSSFPLAFCNDTDDAMNLPISPPTWVMGGLLEDQMEEVSSHGVGRLLEEQSEEESHSIMSLGEKERFYLFNIAMVTIMLFFVALFAGLYLGLLTLDVLDLQILERTSKDEDERRYAREIIPIVEERHRLLVTILLIDTVVYEALPIFLETLVPAWAAVLLSCTLILLFGEIVPAGIFTGPNQLYLAYTLAPMVKVGMWIVYPIATPIARLLDILTQVNEENENGEAYNREEMSALVRIQYEQGAAVIAANQPAGRRPTIKDVIKYERNKDRQWNSLKSEIMERANERNDEVSEDNETAMEQLVPPLHSTEVTMVEGALSLKTKLAMDVYTPFSHVYALPENLILNKASVTDIFSEGYSRVPVYRPNPLDPDDTSMFLGFLITRHLMMIDWQDNREVSTLYLQRPKCVSPRMNLVDTLKVLQDNGPQLTFICARPDLANKALSAEEPISSEAGLMGIITLVDIMESVLQNRIYDEEDIRERERAVSTLKRWAATKLASFMRKAAQAAKQKHQTSTVIIENLPFGDFPMEDMSPQTSPKQVVKSTVKPTVNETTPLLSGKLGAMDNTMDMV